MDVRFEDRHKDQHSAAWRRWRAHETREAMQGRVESVGGS
jgi:hypothetical protein